jgi:iron only hydrogenase large subunit-like protein
MEHLSEKDKFRYKIALPAPALYGQFNNLENIDYVLTGLKKMGFDKVVEVSKAAEYISSATRNMMRTESLKKPVISTACPAVVRLIRIRFPNLIPNLLPLYAPVDFAAKIAREEAIKETGLKDEEIGVFFISPCPLPQGI